LRTRYSKTIRRAAVCIWFLFCIMICPTRALAQGLLSIKPAKVEFDARAGQTVEKVLKLANTGADKAEILDLRLVELTQGRNGAVWMIEPGSELDTSKLASCLKWVKLSAESVEVQPVSRAVVTVTVKIPPSARGFYSAGLLANVRRQRADKGVSIFVRFLIPILVEIQGRPVRQKIELNDVGMDFIEDRQEQPATTLLSLGIANQGRTFSRIKGTARVMRYWEGHWGHVTTAKFKELGILPGIELNLQSDLARRLPSGRYKLTGTLYVDGRRIRPLEKEVDFAGDPTVTRLAVDTPLTLEPPILSVIAVPGANRTAVIKIENASGDPVTIEAAAAIPPVLRGVALGDLKGEDLSCAEWVKVMPEKFTLRGGGRQNIGAIIKMPRAENMHANYYGVLSLRARYADGQSAGETTTLVLVENKNVPLKPAAQVVKVTLAADEPSKYIVQAKSANIGNVHYTPKCTAELATVLGPSVMQTLLSGKTGLMLPLETRDFSGVLDFSRVNPGTYLIKGILEYADRKAVNKELPIRVSLDDSQQRLVEIIKPGEKEPELAAAPAETGKSRPGSREASGYSRKTLGLLIGSPIGFGILLFSILALRRRAHR